MLANLRFLSFNRDNPNNLAIIIERIAVLNISIKKCRIIETLIFFISSQYIILFLNSFFYAIHKIRIFLQETQSAYKKRKNSILSNHYIFSLSLIFLFKMSIIVSFTFYLTFLSPRKAGLFSYFQRYILDVYTQSNRYCTDDRVPAGFVGYRCRNNCDEIEIRSRACSSILWRYNRPNYGMPPWTL